MEGLKTVNLTQFQFWKPVAVFGHLDVESMTPDAGSRNSDKQIYINF
jgi:hypothetical protein